MTKFNDFYNLAATKDGQKLDLSINDDIGDFWTDTTSEAFAHILRDKSITEIDVEINTRGGSVTEGISMFNQLKNHPATVTTNVTGQAASIGMVVFAAGDNRKMGLGTTLHAHPVKFSMMGTFSEGELREIADEIPKLQSSVADILQSASTTSRENLDQMLSKETKITSSEALEMGLATEITKVEAVNLTSYKKYQPVNYKEDKEKIQQVLNNTSKILNNKSHKDNVMEKNEFDKRLAEFDSKLTIQTSEMENLKTNLVKATDMVTNYKDQVVKLEGTIVEMNNKTVRSEFTNYVESLVVQCKVTPDEKEEIITNLEYRNKDSIEMLNSYKELLNSRKPKFSLQKNFANKGNGTENALGDGVALTDEEKAAKKKIMQQAVKRKGVR